MNILMTLRSLQSTNWSENIHNFKCLCTCLTLYTPVLVLVPMQHTSRISRGLSGPLTFGWSVPQHLCLRFSEGCFEHLQRSNYDRPDDNMKHQKPLVDRWGDLDPQRCVPANSLAPGGHGSWDVMGCHGSVRPVISHVAPLARAAHRWPAGPWPSKTPYKATRPAGMVPTGTNTRDSYGGLQNTIIWDDAVICCDCIVQSSKVMTVMTHDL